MRHSLQAHFEEQSTPYSKHLHSSTSEDDVRFGVRHGSSRRLRAPRPRGQARTKGATTKYSRPRMSFSRRSLQNSSSTPRIRFRCRIKVDLDPDRPLLNRACYHDSRWVTDQASRRMCGNQAWRCDQKSGIEKGWTAMRDRGVGRPHAHLPLDQGIDRAL